MANLDDDGSGSTWSLEECQRLVKECREDDTKMDRAPWNCMPLIIRFHADDRPRFSNAFGVARLRNNLSAIVAQLEASLAMASEIAFLRDQLARASSVAKREFDAREGIEIERDALEQSQLDLRMKLEACWDERDAARAERDAARLPALSTEDIEDLLTLRAQQGATANAIGHLSDDVEVTCDRRIALIDRLLDRLSGDPRTSQQAVPAQRVEAKRVRATVLRIAGDVLRHPDSKVLRTFDVADEIAERVTAELVMSTLSAEEMASLVDLRARLTAMAKSAHPTDPTDELALLKQGRALDCLLGGLHAAPRVEAEGVRRVVRAAVQDHVMSVLALGEEGVANAIADQILKGLAPPALLTLTMALELQCCRASMARLEEWAKQLEVNRDKPGDVGHFIATELRARLGGER